MVDQDKLRRLAAGFGLFKIVIAGPWGPGFLVDIDGQGEFVISTNGEAWLVDELRRISPMFGGVPVFHKHDDLTGPARSRLLVGDKTRVGKITRSWWQPATKEIRGVLSVESDYWREELKRPADRWAFGFSWDVAALVAPAGGLDVIYQIPTIFSVDLVHAGAVGGRWLDAPKPSEAQLEQMREACAWRMMQNGRERTD